MSRPDTGRHDKVRQTAPDTKAVSKAIWAALEGQPGFNERMRAAEVELEAGGGVLYEVRDGSLRKVRKRSRAPRHSPPS
jgi:hypothetical protein